MRPSHHSRQLGASLLEVLVAILILSFGMLALSGLLAFSVQAPKLAAYRATATSLAASHIERMRANPAGFGLDSYKETMTYNTTLPTLTPCAYPACTPDSIAAFDKSDTNATIRRQLGPTSRWATHYAGRHIGGDTSDQPQRTAFQAHGAL